MSRSRSKVLVWGEAVTLSHVVRPAVLAGALDPERYDVVFACDPRYAHVLDLPFETMSVESRFPTDGVADRLATMQPIFDVPTLDANVGEDLDVLAAVTPDLVVADMRQSLAISGPIAGVPVLNIMNAHWSPNCPLDREVVDVPIVSMAPAPIGDLLARLMYPVGSAVLSFPANAVRVKYGLPPIGLDTRDVFSFGDYVVHPDIPELTPLPDVPRNHRYIGPILWSPEVATPEWWDAVPSDKPVIYVSLGSSGRQPLLGPILEALSRLPVTVMAATAGAELDAPVPANAFVADYLPGVEAARRARLVVSSGGSMPAWQALACGTPVLAVPTNIDQLVFAKLVARAGAGEVIRDRDLEPAPLRRLVWRMLNQESCADAARGLASAAARYDAPSRFAAFVRDILADNGSIHSGDRPRQS